MTSKVELKGMKIDNVDKQRIFAKINEEVIGKSKDYISITNTEAMYIGLNDEKHSKFINNSYLSLCDGTGLVIAGKFHGIKITKYHGPDFFEDALNEGQKYGWTHYFLGGQKGIAEKLIEKFKEKLPKVKIIGHYSPPFRDLTQDEETAMIERINKLKPNFVWVSLGLPKQEKWILNFIDRLDTNLLIGVGASFDFHSNNVRRAPLFYRRIGLEWFYRTCFERRMIIRQVRAFKFMFNAILNNKSNK